MAGDINSLNLLVFTLFQSSAFKGSAGECEGCCISFVLYEQIWSNRFCDLTMFVSYR